MNARERVIRAIEFGYPDRLPLRYDTSRQRADYISLPTGRPAGWQPARPGLDEWGCYWEQQTGPSLGQVKGNPLADWDALADYVVPDPHAPGRLDEARRIAAEYPDRYLSGDLGLTGFNRAFYLRGFENLMVDLLTAPDRVQALTRQVMSYENGLAVEYAHLGAQAVAFGDDLGTETGLMMNPALWRQVFKPLYREQFAYVHSLGLHVVFHSCGNVWDILGDLIEIGVDVLNLQQVQVFGLDRLAATYAGKVCFESNPDSQRVLPVASPEVVEAETERVVNALSLPSGGLIGIADCTWNAGTTPPANLAAMARAFEALRYRVPGHISSMPKPERQQA